MKVLTLLLLVPIGSALCQAVERDMQALYLSIYGTPEDSSSGIVPEGSDCKAADDMEGECLIKRKCHTGGVNGVAKAIQSTCTRLQVCCPIVNTPPATTRSPKPPPAETDEDESREPIKCGKRNTDGIGNRILGRSDNAIYTEFPWMVAVYTRNVTQRRNRYNPFGHRLPQKKEEPLLYTCGGSLIHLAVVLTAAHCVENKGSVRVRAGDWDLDSKNEMFPYQEQMTSQVILHDNYDTEKNQYDAALLILEQPFTDADNIGVICLPPVGLVVKSDSRCMASGWGVSNFDSSASYQNILKVVELPIVNHRACQNQLRPHFRNYFVLHHSFMCAGGKSDEDTCKGDGGSPLICSDGMVYFQHGIVSWGIGCGNAGTPGVYTNVFKLRRWIDRKMQHNGLSESSYTYIP